MNLDNVAKLVHSLAKGQYSSSLLLAKSKSIRGITNSEFDAITKVFGLVTL